MSNLNWLSDFASVLTRYFQGVSELPGAPSLLGRFCLPLKMACGSVPHRAALITAFSALTRLQLSLGCASDLLGT